MPVAAADYFFDIQKQELAGVLDKQWRATYGRDWAERHNQIGGGANALRNWRRCPPRQLSTYSSAARWSNANVTRTLRFNCIWPRIDRGMPRQTRGRPHSLESRRRFRDSSHRHGHGRGCQSRQGRLQDRRRIPGGPRPVHQRESVPTPDDTRDDEGLVGARGTIGALDPGPVRPCANQSIDVVALSRRLALEPDVLRVFLAVKELRYSSGTQTVLAVLATNGVVSDPGQRLRREGLLPDQVTVVALDRTTSGSRRRSVVSGARCMTDHCRVLSSILRMTTACVVERNPSSSCASVGICRARRRVDRAMLPRRGGARHSAQSSTGRSMENVVLPPARCRSAVCRSCA